MALCPSGHESEWDDYCSVCGVSMTGEAPVGSEQAQARAPRAGELSGEAQAACPNCAEPHAAGDVFCENCGYDFLTGTLPDETAAATAAEAALHAEVPATVAVISIDLSFFERMGFEGVEPPATLPEPVRVELPPSDILVGRHSESRGTFPEIDLSEVFQGDATDPAVSSSHCRLHRGSHGWTVTDLDSTNGTYLADSDEALRPGTAISLIPGTPIFVGAWTRIELVEGA